MYFENFKIKVRFLSNVSAAGDRRIQKFNFRIWSILIRVRQMNVPCFPPNEPHFMKIREKSELSTDKRTFSISRTFALTARVAYCYPGLLTLNGKLPEPESDWFLEILFMKISYVVFWFFLNRVMSRTDFWKSHPWKSYSVFFSKSGQIKIWKIRPNCRFQQFGGWLSPTFGKVIQSRSFRTYKYFLDFGAWNNDLWKTNPSR